MLSLIKHNVAHLVLSTESKFNFAYSLETDQWQQQDSYIPSFEELMLDKSKHLYSLIIGPYI